jgi:hypothetical protein
MLRMAKGFFNRIRTSFTPLDNLETFSEGLSLCLGGHLKQLLLFPRIHTKIVPVVEKPSNNKTNNVHLTLTRDARSCNHFCSGKAISIIQTECVFVALGIEHAMHMRRIVM